MPIGLGTDSGGKLGGPFLLGATSQRHDSPIFARGQLLDGRNRNTVCFDSVLEKAMKIEVRYSWRYKWGGRMVTSSIKMTEERVRKESPDAVRLDDTREEVLVMDQPCEIDQANIDLVTRCLGKEPVRLSRLHRPKTVPQEGDFVPLPHEAALYQIHEAENVWTVTSTATSPHRIVYQGRGPVSVEPTP